MSNALRQVILAFLVVRLVASFSAIVGNASVPRLEDKERVAVENSVSEPSRAYRLLVSPMVRWDSHWYIKIAKDGYDPNSGAPAFMPVYPMLIRAVHWVTRLEWNAAAVLISNLAAFAALYLLYLLVHREFGHEVASRAVWLQALFPGSLYFMAAYTESLFLALALAAFYFARGGRWYLAGIFAAVSGITRSVGSLVVVPLMVEYLMQWRERRLATTKAGMPKSAGWIFFAPLGMIGLVLFWYFSTGDPLKFVHVQSGWQRQLQNPVTTVWGGIKQAWTYAEVYPGGVYILEATAILLALALGVVSFFRLRLSYAVYLMVSILPALSMPFGGRLLTSCMRYSSVLFPMFIVLALLIKTETGTRACLSAFAVLYGLAMTLFVSGHYMF